MIREDILGGLKLAILRGGTLKDAMMSFYNAGYTKEEIESAAKTLQNEYPDLTISPVFAEKKVALAKKIYPKVKPDHEARKPFLGELKKPVEKPVQEEQEETPENNEEEYAESSKKESTIGPSSIEKELSQRPIYLTNPVYISQPQSATRQIISKYEEIRRSPQNMLVIVLLVALLFILLSSLIGIFIFRQEIVNFFNSLFQ
jgi:hypothetical protein